MAPWLSFGDFLGLATPEILLALVSAQVGVLAPASSVRERVTALYEARISPADLGRAVHLEHLAPGVRAVRWRGAQWVVKTLVQDAPTLAVGGMAAHGVEVAWPVVRRLRPDLAAAKITGPEFLCVQELPLPEQAAGAPQGPRSVAVHLLMRSAATDLEQELAAAASSGAGVDVPTQLGRMRQVAAGLANLHDAGVVHGDVKPGNILLAAAGSVGDVAADAAAGALCFGSFEPEPPASPRPLDAALADLGSAVTAATTVWGPRVLTPAYACPWQLATGVPSVLGDVHALAVSCVTALVGAPVLAGRLQDQAAALSTWTEMACRVAAAWEEEAAQEAAGGAPATAPASAAVLALLGPADVPELAAARALDLRATAPGRLALAALEVAGAAIFAPLAQPAPTARRLAASLGALLDAAEPAASAVPLQLGAELWSADGDVAAAAAAAANRLAPTPTPTTPPSEQAEADAEASWPSIEGPACWADDEEEEEAEEGAWAARDPEGAAWFAAPPAPEPLEELRLQHLKEVWAEGGAAAAARRHAAAVAAEERGAAGGAEAAGAEAADADAGGECTYATIGAVLTSLLDLRPREVSVGWAPLAPPAAPVCSPARNAGEGAEAGWVGWWRGEAAAACSSDSCSSGGGSSQGAWGSSGGGRLA